MIASSMLYPSNESTATTALVPVGLSSRLRSEVDFVFTSGGCGYTRRCSLTYVLNGYVGVGNPRDSFAIADSYVFLGDWLCCGYGMIDAAIPSIPAGYISRCVDLSDRCLMSIAIRAFSSSFASISSITPI